ncbi:MAG TPA: MDR family MFS transporter [Tepidisphaeraceae bacterium]|jgi:MFS family permease|nr:MDR family MFS transporter [Tepidisphaeraceae bacterium]
MSRCEEECLEPADELSASVETSETDKTPMAVDMVPPSPVQIAEARKTGPRMDRRWVTAALMLVMVLASMEQTVTSTAMPTIIGSLHGLEHYSWVASIYLLACTVSMPLYGRLADALGRKRVILFAIALFALSSMLASTARTMPQLIAYRGLQGLGAGGIMPVVLTILGDIFTLEERAQIQGLFSAVWGTASLAGPALGWFLIATLGWKSIFFVNLPFGLLGMIVLMRYYHDQEKPRSVHLDLPGIFSLAVACTALLTLLSRLGPGGWPWHVSAILAAVAIASAIFFTLNERDSANPVMPVDLLMNLSIGPSLLGSFLLGIGFLSLDTFVPLYVQGVRGGGPGAAAWVVTPVMLTWALSGIIAAPLVVRWGFRNTSMLGSALIVVGFSGLLLCTAVGASKHVLAAVLALTGLGFGPSSMSFLLSAQNAVSWQRRGIVTSSVQFFRTIGGSMGIGILGAVFNIITQPKLRGLESSGVTPAALLDPHLRTQLSASILKSAGWMIESGLHWVFIGMLGVAILQLIVSRWMPLHSVDHVPSKSEMAEAMVG